MQPICTMDSLRLQLSICIFFLFNFSANSILVFSYFWLWAITKCSISFSSTEMCAPPISINTYTYSIGCKKNDGMFICRWVFQWFQLYQSELVLKHRIPLNMMQTKSSHTQNTRIFISNQPELLQIIVRASNERALIISING